MPVSVIVADTYFDNQHNYIPVSTTGRDVWLKLEQLRKGYFKMLGKSANVIQRNVLFTALNGSDIRSMDVRLKAKLFLRKS
jgi:hypothetical protein